MPVIRRTCPHHLDRVEEDSYALGKYLSSEAIENLLHHLNCRRTLEALALWRGDEAPFKPYEIYEGYEQFINLSTLSHIDALKDKVSRTRLRHALIDHYLQRELLPHETEMRAWMKRARAHVKGQKISFSEIIPWCQKSSSLEERRLLQKETGPLCKFLRPFALNYWNVLLEIIQKDLGFENYLHYCHDKKGIDYEHYYRLAQGLLCETDELYFSAMDRWARERFDLPLHSLTRFDAINLLGLGEFDSLFPAKGAGDLNQFFHHWDIDLERTPGLTLDLEREKEKSAQGMCFIIQVPEEVYILMRPEGGWVDLETLWHELGHGLAAVFTSPQLSIVERDMATSYSLSESFAFLLQNVALSAPFLEDYLEINRIDSERISYYKVLKDLSVFRRYAAKFITEYDMFLSGDLSNGEHYAEMMARSTGFYYQPESHLFDLVPEFYSLDYLQGWMGEAILVSYLEERIGREWIFSPEAGHILRKWWKQGNRYDIGRFMERNTLAPLAPELLLRRWQEVLN